MAHYTRKAVADFRAQTGEPPMGSEGNTGYYAVNDDFRCGRQEFHVMLSIRAATVNDVGLLKALIYELAEYEREKQFVMITEADLVRDGFGAAPEFRALIAEWDGQAAGYALFFGFYSTWEGRPGLFLEDLFVRQAFRGKGVGRALLAKVAGIARRENCYGVRWEVLDWNQPAIDFYKRLGASFLDQWKSVLLTGEALDIAGKMSE
jgi:GNAT superfamily N-acetyltransferase